MATSGAAPSAARVAAPSTRRGVPVAASATLRLWAAPAASTTSWASSTCARGRTPALPCRGAQRLALP
eukprot:11462315-Alexandrium_andersonii.AAC.1